MIVTLKIIRHFCLVESGKIVTLKITPRKTFSLYKILIFFESCPRLNYLDN